MCWIDRGHRHRHHRYCQIHPFERSRTSNASEASSTRSAATSRSSLGALDAAYIRRTILFQRTLDVAARLLIAGTRSKAGWALGAAALGFAKTVENMEIGHNVSHGQWDWMNDPEIHSSTWEWDMVAVSSQWKYSHNYRHHVFSNVLGVDDDLGFGVMRVTRDQPWKRQYLLQPLQNLFLALTFEWGIAAHGVDLERGRRREGLADKGFGGEGRPPGTQGLRACGRR